MPLFGVTLTQPIGDSLRSALKRVDRLGSQQNGLGNGDAKCLCGAQVDTAI
jgi:hypothetical protein